MRSTLLKRLYYHPFKGSFSQYGEDVLIDKLLGSRPLGFYVDVGAFDPDRLSNTKKFYLRGWNGINIEPNPDGIGRFNRLRPRDINLNIGISDRAGIMPAYKFYETASYTFSKEFVVRNKAQGFKLEKELSVKVDTLESVLDKHLGGRQIDFISIDTEGCDMAVLEGNNWKKYRPTVVCVESLSVEGSSYGERQEEFLNSKGYKKVYDTGLNSLYFRTCEYPRRPSGDGVDKKRRPDPDALRGRASY